MQANQCWYSLDRRRNKSQRRPILPYNRCYVKSQFLILNEQENEKESHPFCWPGLLLFAMYCKESEFIEAYPDPAKLAATTIEKQFTGFLKFKQRLRSTGLSFILVTLITIITMYKQQVG